MSFCQLRQNENNLTKPLLTRSRIEGINRLQKEVKTQLHDIPTIIAVHKVYGLAVSYTRLALILTTIIILLIKTLFKRRISSPHGVPEPVPRSTWDISLDPIAWYVNLVKHKLPVINANLLKFMVRWRPQYVNS